MAAPKVEETRWQIFWRDGSERYAWAKTQERYDVLQYQPGREMRVLVNHADPKVHEELLILVDMHWE